ncbi:MAG: PQQ-like beta-propeller repeat protein, partial [Planctomycetes bacterium]|nr:PQQ-like beta-propeller repeat protein [Planctomycetota bacterium]
WVSVPSVVFFSTLWWVFLSGMCRRTRFIGLGILAAIAGLFLGLFRWEGFSGDFLPQFTFRWSPSAEERAEEYWASVSTIVEMTETTDSGAPLEITATDWPQFRGPNRDGIVTDSAIRRDWKSNPPQLLWKHPLGKGWSSFAVVDRFAFTQEQRGEQECVVCYDIETGEHVWTHSDTVRFKSFQGGPGPMATPTLFDSRVYSVGGKGLLNCLEARTGKQVWSTNILDDADAQNLTWGMSGSPLVYDDVVVVNPGGGQGNSVAAYDRLTGEKLWTAGNEPAGYSSPSLAVIDGVRQVLVFHNIGICGYHAGTGEQLWTFNLWKNHSSANAAQPIVRDEKQIFISCGYGKGSALLEVTKEGAQWIVKDKKINSQTLHMKFTSGVYKDGYVYGLDERILSCVEFNTGQRKWRKRGKFGYGQLLLVDDALLILTESGEVVLFEAKPNSPRELGRFKAIEGITWNHPVLHKGRLLVRNGEEVACYDLRSDSAITQND